MLFEHFSRSFNHKHNHWFTSFKNLYFLVDRRRPVVIEKYKHDLLLLMKIIEAGVEMMKWKTLVDRIISQVTDTTSSLICITALVSVKYETLSSAAAQSVTVSAAAAASATLISWGSHATAVSSHTRVSLPGSTVCPGQARAVLVVRELGWREQNRFLRKLCGAGVMLRAQKYRIMQSLVYKIISEQNILCWDHILLFIDIFSKYVLWRLWA